ncbi:MAG: PadR family transcriptional regulator [Acholeplasmataceae bacterium]|nr:PadR family transcriptional regulator [Acholeplasmataceae bacterium]
MISSDIIRGYNDTIILSVLTKEASYGYEISKTIKRLSDDKYIIKETTLYSAFSRLEKNGYIEPFFQETDPGSRRTYYKITSEGITYLNEKKEEWVTTQEVINAFIK